MCGARGYGFSTEARNVVVAMNIAKVGFQMPFEHPQISRQLRITDEHYRYIEIGCCVLRGPQITALLFVNKMNLGAGEMNPYSVQRSCSKVS